VFSRTLVPTLAKYLLRAGVLDEHGHPRPSRNPLTRFHRAFERGFSGVRDAYGRFLERCLHHQKFFIVAFLIGCVISAGLLPWVGRDFFPTVDAGQFKLHLRAKTGTRIEETARICDLVEKEMRKIIPPGELDTIIDNIGLPLSGTNMSYNMSGTLGPADADIQVALNKGHRPTEGYMRLLRQQLPEKFPGIGFYFLPADIVSQILNFGLPAPIDIQVIGRNVAANRVFALGLFQKLKQVSGIADLRIQQPFDQPKLDVTVDRTRAQQAGFSQRDVANNMLIALSGSSQTSPTYWLNPKNGVSYTIITQTPQYSIDSLQALSNIPISGPNAAKPGILGDFATVERGAEGAVASHWNVQPVIDVFGSVQGTDLGTVADDVNRIVAANMKDLPKGTRLIVRGQIETMLSSFQGLLYGLIFAIVLVYLLMVVNFQSWLDPFIIITALPAALAGIVWMLFATGTTVSVPALTGAIMAMGIATANSILVVSFARERLDAGADSVRAAIEAGVGRFRPVLMTALAMIIGMVPMALGLGEGGEQNAPLGRAVIGGLLFATVATLLFVPAVFAFIHGMRARGRPVGSALGPQHA
jgi:multidrug efflux pump subunit AcrB